MHRKALGRIIVSLIGASLIMYSVSTILLGIIGESSSAAITNVRREAGELNSSRSGYYMYNISYSFTLPNGETVEGYDRKFSDGAYVKKLGTIVIVRYLEKFPQINAVEEDTQLNLGKMVLVSAGLCLIFIINKKE
ncbi:MAG: hypothetical protein AAGU76_13740 [Sedimentibacter sp.]|uniref:hypothetical protein n=1 Tax=Sedimentibacter sp. TaxID=1960295 RepID=UPI003158CF6B